MVTPFPKDTLQGSVWKETSSAQLFATESCYQEPGIRFTKTDVLVLVPVVLVYVSVLVSVYLP